MNIRAIEWHLRKAIRDQRRYRRLVRVKPPEDHVHQYAKVRLQQTILLRRKLRVVLERHRPT